MANRFCPDCGTKLETGVKFCPNCGAAIPQEENVPQAAPQQPVQIVMQQPAPQMQYAPPDPRPAAYTSADGHVVNKTAYCLLALFLGGLGVHKFYSGKIVLGIVYLVFCWTWIPAIVAFVEFIIALTKKSDAYGNIAV